MAMSPGPSRERLIFRYWRSLQVVSGGNERLKSLSELKQKRMISEVDAGLIGLVATQREWPTRWVSERHGNRMQIPGVGRMSPIGRTFAARITPNEVTK